MNTKHKIKAIVAIAVALAFLAPGSAVFASGDEATFVDTTVSIDPSTQIAEKGNSFTVDVLIDPDISHPSGDGASGAQFDLFFDETLIQADSVVFPSGYIFEGHSVMSDLGTIDNLNGKIAYVYCIVIDADPLPTDPGVFVTISFTALNIGTSLLDLDAVKVTDFDGDPVSIVVYDGSVTVEEYAYLTIDVDGEGITSPPEGVHTYEVDDIVPLGYTADPGWTFDSWTGPDAGEIVSGLITMTKDMFITAYFTEDEYTLDITIIDSGTVTKDPDEATYTYDTVVTLITDPVIGWSFGGWSGPDASEIVGDKITMTKDMEVTATFTEDEYVLDITIEGAGCSVDVTPGPYIHGTVVTLTPVPDTIAGWIFTSWSGPDAGLIVGDQITMTKDMEITAMFMQEWTVQMIITGNIEAPSFDLRGDEVFFGESITASDGKDSKDIPCPPTPNPPYIAAWFETDFESPYDRLEKDIRRFETPEGTTQVWDLWVETDTAGTADTVEIEITWDTDDLGGCEFDYVGLYDALSGDLLADMTAVGTHTITVDDEMKQHFRVIGSWLHQSAIEKGWNLISMPAYEENFDKTNLIIQYSDGIEYTWNDAVYWGIILEYTYGWDDGVYSNDNCLTRGDGYWLWSYYDNCKIIVPTSAAPEDHITTFDDGEGWYLVGAPYTSDLRKGDVNIQYNAQYYTWNEAAYTNKFILPYLYKWDRATQNYEISENPEFFAVGHGYWMYVYEPCSLKRV